MTQATSPNDLRAQIARFVNNGLFLVCEHLGRQVSREFMQLDSDRNRIIPIFDTDIIISACAPWRMGPRHEKGTGGYGAILPNVADDIEESTEIGEKHETELARLLAEFALLRSSNGNEIPARAQGIFQLQAHYGETAKIYEYVYDNAKRASGDASDLAARQREAGLAGRLGALISNRMQATDDKSEHLQLAASFVKFLSQQKAPSGRNERSITEWDNFLSLNRRSGGLYPIDEAPQVLAEWTGGIPTPELVSALAAPLPDPRQDFERDLHCEIVAQWTKRFKRFKQQSSETDAKAIADLFLLNYRLLKRQPSARRIVFVTGDMNLCITSYQSVKLPDGLLQRFYDKLAESGIENPKRVAGEYLDNFAYRHIRHLWAYLEEAVITSTRPASRKDDSVGGDVADMEWLHGLLAKWSGGLRFSRGYLVDLLEALADEDGNHNLRREFGRAIDELTKDSRKRTEIVGAVGRFKSSLIYNIENKEFQSFQRYSDLLPKIVHRFRAVDPSGTRVGWNEIVKMISDDVARHDDATVVSLSNVGVGVLLASRRSETSHTTRRNPPPLLFDRFMAPKNIVTALLRLPDRDELAAFEKAYQAIPEECRKLLGDNSLAVDGVSIYLRYLVLGVLFASAKRWGVAHSHAIRAIEITKREQMNFGLNIPVNGREAYFLASSTKRIIAHRAMDYDIAAQDLARAENAYVLDVQFSEMNEKTKIAHELRFANEKLALTLSRYYFARFKEPDAPFAERVRGIYDAAEAMIKRQDCAMATLKVTDLVSLAEFVDPIIVTSLATNLLQVRTSHEFRRWKFDTDQLPCPVDNARVLGALDVMSRLTGTLSEGETDGKDVNRRVMKTTLMSYYEVVGKLVLLREGIEVRGGIPDFMPLKLADHDLGIASYDQWRHESLVDFAQSILNEMTGKGR